MPKTAFSQTAMKLTKVWVVLEKLAHHIRCLLRKAVILVSHHNVGISSICSCIQSNNVKTSMAVYSKGHFASPSGKRKEREKGKAPTSKCQRTSWSILSLARGQGVQLTRRHFWISVSLWGELWCWEVQRCFSNRKTELAAPVLWRMVQSHPCQAWSPNPTYLVLRNSCC